MSSRKEQKERARAERKVREAAAQAVAQRKRRLWQLLGVTVIAAAAVVAAIVISQSSTSSNSGGKAKGIHQANALFSGISQQGIILGDPKAPVTMTEFADLQCPACQQYTDTVLESLVEKYVRPGKVKMQLRLLHFIGPDSEMAARLASAAAAQNRLWQFTDLFYRNQGEENSGYVTDAYLRKIANGVNRLDVEQAFSNRDSQVADKALKAADALAASNGVDSTPSFLIGKTGERPQPFANSSLEQFETKLDSLLRR